MSKELEVLKKIEFAEDDKERSDLFFTYAPEIEQALQRLESIENANPSEALGKLKENTEMFDEIAKENNHSYKDDTVIEAFLFKANTIEIEQALLKAQSLEKENAEYKKVLEIINKKTVSIFQLKCCKNVDEYNDLKFNDNEKLTEEEFDLLKRWLDEITRAKD